MTRERELELLNRLPLTELYVDHVEADGVDDTKTNQYGLVNETVGVVLTSQRKRLGRDIGEQQ